MLLKSCQKVIKNAIMNRLSHYQKKWKSKKLSSQQNCESSQ